MTSGIRSCWLVALIAILTFSGCTQIPQNHDATEDIDADPLEPINRVIYEFNRAFDGAILRPITVVYRSLMPEQGREMVSNALENLYMPVVFTNSVLQTDPQNSFASFWRFTLNSTIGIGGLFDPASEAGLKYRSTDFGQTLAVYGADSGPYIVVPIIGPSNARDGIGLIADAFINPFNYFNWATSSGIWAATAIDKRSSNMKLLDDVYRTSLDPYTTFRSGYTQKRNADIRRAKAERAKSLEKAGF